VSRANELSSVTDESVMVLTETASAVGCSEGLGGISLLFGRGHLMQLAIRSIP
jgi:hypothetical protein